ncbi:PREDICTED: mitochondrial dicarboxylate carrier-like isoform X2 [Priapulus caudatus]|uniref:Mitochondrial dicarboxylate carrier-like isoform X2 n=1 Tax=Priapulus caudatus TaxID=37621 RepID=A0ABM1F947_PRICU|nr:PREDICTED: mitochondrial dicarboxylate carrier-like isoform X2 [Priapulus caudatus]
MQSRIVNEKPVISRSLPINSFPSQVHLQTPHQGKVTLTGMAVKVVKNEGVRGLYNGLTASLLRQLTYSTTRFGVYEVAKQTWINSQDDKTKPLPFYMKILIAGTAGAMGGFVGTPGDMVNVRMQNDMKIEKALRRNYKHALDGVWRVYCEEGFTSLFSGASMATSRAVLMTVGQIAFYDQIKQVLVGEKYMNDNIGAHFVSSLLAGLAATTITQPLDVLKTRVMSAKPGEYRSVFHCIAVTAKQGPLAFYKGYIPAFVRLAPQTILTFIFFEQLRTTFGYYRAE